MRSGILISKGALLILYIKSYAGPFVNEGARVRMAYFLISYFLLGEPSISRAS